MKDNFYEDGIDNTTDPLWNTAFHDIYKAASLEIPWYPILGNHDYHVDPQSQIDRTYAEDETMWTMPARYYVFNYTLPGGGIVSVVNIDTQLIDTDHDDTTDVIYSTPNWKKMRSAHLKWIDQTLEEQSKIATWVLVAGHYPIYSVGVNGDNTVLLGELHPILVKHKIHAYIAGHDHSNQFATMDDGITYIVSAQGAGRGPFGSEGVKFYGISKSSNYMQHYSSECGFSYVKMDDDFMNVSFVNVDGKVTFTGVLSNPHTADYRQSLMDGSSNHKGQTGTTKNHRVNPQSTDGSTAATIFLPGLFIVTLLIFYIGRNTPQVQGIMSSVTNAVEVIQNALREAQAGTRSDEKIVPAIDMSTRSDVGLTADMDRSGRRQNISPREMNDGRSTYLNTSYLPPQSQARLEARKGDDIA